MEEIIVYFHTDCLLKNNGTNHPERKERLEVILKTIEKIKDIKIVLKKAPLADLEIVTLVHPEKYIDYIFKIIPRKCLIGVESEPYSDTFLCPKIKNAILRACGAGIAGADMLIKKDKKRIFCLVRPPGHHAETTRANGFCFINNAAVTARYLQKKYNINKIAIIDFDVHHGNGSQEIFYEDESIAYGSIHQHPLFPGSGLEEETGVGNIYNAPIKAETNGEEFIRIFDNKILQKIEKFKPEIIIISAGFDAHKRDPLSQINLESEHFHTITKKIVEISNNHSQGKIISFLEGGYDLVGLSESFKYHIMGLSE